MATRYSYTGRPWSGLPARDIEHHEAGAFGDELRTAALSGSYIAEDAGALGRVISEPDPVVELPVADVAPMVPRETVPASPKTAPKKAARPRAARRK
jgi:hypothetical protein